MVLFNFIFQLLLSVIFSTLFGNAAKKKKLEVKNVGLNLTDKYEGLNLIDS